MRRRWTRGRVIATLFGSVLLVALVTVVALNLKGPERRIEHKLTHHAGVESELFVRELGALLGPPIMHGNRIEHLENGERIFPAMLDAIRSAQHTVCLETFIYWSGEVGSRFAQALSERARAGVTVNVLLDWVGSNKAEEPLLQRMKNAGVRVRYYRPLRWYHVTRMNHRTHRKLLVVDGRVGFTGGVGIADLWQGHAQDPWHWRDSHFRVEGPVVAHLQGAFVDNWIKTTGNVLHGDRYFPALEARGTVPAQMFTSSPTGGSDSMQLMYLLAVSSAKKTIDLSAAYFVPDATMRRTLREALARGVRVRIIVPGEHIDQDIVRRASRADWGELLRAGALIHEFVPTMFHVKALIVDELLVSVGSTNFDNRSFRLNDECTLNAYDRELAVRMTEVFERDLQRTRRVSLRDWERRPFRERALEWLASQLASQL